MAPRFLSRVGCSHNSYNAVDFLFPPRHEMYNEISDAILDREIENFLMKIPEKGTAVWNPFTIGQAILGKISFRISIMFGYHPEL